MTRDPAGADETRRRITRTTAAVAFVAMLVAVLGLVQLLRPLSTPVQDCGTAASFLVRGGANRFVDPADPPRGVTPAEARDNNATPCQERAANRARPAAIVIVAAILVAVVALLAEWMIRMRWARADRRGAPDERTDGADTAAPPPAPAPSTTGG